MPWLDDARVHRPHRHLVGGFALGLHELRQPDLRPRVRLSVVIAAGKAHGLEPGVAQGRDAPGLEDLALEKMRLRTVRCEGGVGVARRGADGVQHAEPVLGQHGEEPELPRHGRAEQRRQPGLVQHGLQHLGAELLRGQQGNLAQGHGLGVAHG